MDDLSTDTLDAEVNGNTSESQAFDDPEDELSDSAWDRRVYKYGSLPPTTNKHVVFEQMRLAHRYRNLLTEIERERRRAVREIIANAKETNADKAVTKARLKEVDAKALLLRKGARARCNVYWGTYQLAEAADDQSRKTLGIFEDPRFIPWSGEGVVSVQLTDGGITEMDLANDTQVQLVQQPPKKPGMPPNPEFKTLRLRVDSDHRRRPIWAEFPVRLHRPLPAACVIKRVTVRCERISPRTDKPQSGFREHWQVEFVLEIPKPPAKCGTGVVGVDLGWRVMGDELRVCAWATPQDKAKRRHTGELRLSKEELGGFRRVDTLRSTRDDMRNRALGLLSAQRAEWGDKAPEWFREETRSIALWRRPDRLPRLLWKWGKNRFEGDETIYEWLVFWHHRERHLWKWENDQRRKNHEHRKKKYEEFARTLAERFEIVVLEDFDIRAFARRPDKDAPKLPDGRRETQQSERARAYRHMASTSELRLILSNAFLTRGGGECRVPAHNTTRICHSCGNTETFDQAKDITHSCSKCDVEWDQDDNAGTNLCDRYAILKKMLACDPCNCRRTADKSHGAHVRRGGIPKKDMEGRFARGKRMKQERENEEKGATS